MLKKALNTKDVFSIATGAMIGSGFFLLPGIAYAQAGPAVILSYLLAAALIVPALLSKAELATAMPRSGGTYFFVSRSMGPMAGVIDGLGAWLGMIAKSAFALVGVGWYVLAVYGDAGPENLAWVVKAVAAGTALVLALVNVLGAKETGFLQTVLVAGLVAISVWFIGHGSFAIETTRFVPFAPRGVTPVLATAGLVFISYAGLTKVASVSEEVADPEKTIPRGMFLSLGVATVIYVLGVCVLVGVLPGTELEGSRIPLAAAAGAFAGRAGVILMVIAGVFAFVTTANAGILSASRYLHAMGRDKAVPGTFAVVGRRGVPSFGVFFSTAAIVAIAVLLDAERIAKLGSTFMLLDFSLVNLAVIVMRESRMQSYDPGFRSPLYPWVQIAGVILPLVLIELMGAWSISFALGLIAAGLLWYAVYARGRAEHAVAVMRVLEQAAELVLSRERAGPVLDRELRQIMKEKGLRSEDPLAEAVARARVVDLPAGAEWSDVMQQAVEHFTGEHPDKAAVIRNGLYEASRKGDTPAADGIALPHVLLDGIDAYELMVARSRSGLHFPGVELGVKAVFVLLGSQERPQQHLRMLAAIARRVEEPDFLDRWSKAKDGEHLRRVLLGLPGR